MSHLGQKDRLAFLTPKDLANTVQRKTEMRPERLDKNDLVSLGKLVSSYRDNDFNPFFVYTPPLDETGQGFTLGMPDFKNIAFVGIQTEDMLDKFKKYGRRGICADSTHNLTRYMFKLVTVLVYDDAGNGYAIALYITLRESAEELKPLFSHLKRQ